MTILLVLSIACAEVPTEPPAAPAAPALPEPPPSGPSTVALAFPPPRGAVRADADPFGDSLRDLPVRAADAPILTHDGRVVRHHGRVIDLPLVPGDLQQCADSILRVRGEWLLSRGADVSFHATSGTPLPWSRFAAGEKVVLAGDDLRWTPGPPATWDQYLAAVFTWAGTASLAERETRPDDRPDPGDVLVDPGFPGHAVLLLDVARRGDETFVLVGEGFMPAQDFHVEIGPEAGWWRYDDGVDLPHWRLPASTLRTWR